MTMMKRAGISGQLFFRCLGPKGWIVAAIALLVAWGAPAVELDLAGQAAPPTAPEPVTVRSLWSVDRARPGDRVTLAIILDVAEGYHINADQAQIKPLAGLKPMATGIRILVPHPDLITAPAIFPPAHPVRLGFAEEPLMVFDGPTAVLLPLAVRTGAGVGQASLDLEIGYQACDGTSCLLPQKQRISVCLPIVESAAAITTSADPVFEPSATQAGQDVHFDLFGWHIGLTPSSLAARAGLLVLAAIGGFLLNFTPCVLPLVPIKIMGLAHAAGTDPRRCLVLGLFTFSGVMAFWVGLGVMMAAISGFTTTNQLFQYPAFTITVGLVIVAMAAGMMGFFEVRLPGFVYLFNPDQQRLPGAFGMGVLTAVLSTPCTAPFMGAAAAWAAAQRPFTALAVFAAIGAGMGLPYLVLAARPHWIRAMPRTGPGSVLLKQVMGLLMMAAAAYFIGTGLSTLGQGRLPTSLYWWAVAGFAAAAGIWLGLRGLRITQKSRWRIAVGVLALAIVSVSVAAGFRLTRQDPIDWVPYTPAAFDRSLAAGKITLLIFTAEWCLNCKALEQTVLRHADVIRALRAADVVPYKADLTAGNVDANAKLKQVGRLAIPLAVVVAPSGQIVFLSDFYTAGQIVTAIEKARKQTEDGRPKTED